MRPLGRLVITPGAALAVAISWIALAVLAGFLVQQSYALSNERSARLQDACMREQTDRNALRKLIVFFEVRTLDNKTIPQKQKPAIIKFYDDALKLIPPISC